MVVIAKIGFRTVKVECLLSMAATLWSMFAGLGHYRTAITMGDGFLMGVALRHLDYQQCTAGRVSCSQRGTWVLTVSAIDCKQINYCFIKTPGSIQSCLL